MPLCVGNARDLCCGTTTANSLVWPSSMAMVSGKDLLGVYSAKGHMLYPGHACIESISFALCAVAQVYVAYWWMMSYNSPTPKRQQARSNWAMVSGLDAGKLARGVMREKTKVATTRLYLSCSMHRSALCDHKSLDCYGLLVS